MHVRVLTIAGLDPCAGAGMTADVRMIHARGGDVAALASCLTVQNRHGFVRAEPVDGAWLADSIAAVFDDGPVDAVKVGMVVDPATVDTIAAALGHRGVPIVVDPVFSATVEGYDAHAELPERLRDELLPMTTVVTPNQRELARLGSIEDLLERSSVLVTGGDAGGDEVVDVLHTKDGVHEFRAPRVQRTMAVHGTGCALSTVIAFYLGGGAPLEIACSTAIDDVRRCIEATPDEGSGTVVPLRVV